MKQVKKHWRANQILLGVILFIGIIISQFVSSNTFVKAVSCNVNLSMEEKAVLVDSSFLMTITVEGEEDVNGVEMILTYDSELLEYVTSSPAITGDDGTLKVSDLDIATESNLVKYSVKFKVKKAGVSYVKVSSDASIYNEASGQSMSVASNVLTVVGEALELTSDNNNLISLKISGGQLTSEFTSDVTEYTVNVDKGVKKLIISAQTEEDSAKVTIKGNDSLKIGENQIQVIVEAENGDTKEYTIYAICDEEPEQDTSEVVNTVDETKEPENPENKEDLLQPIHVVKENNHIMITTFGVFEIVDLPMEVKLPEGYIQTTINIEYCEVTAYENPKERTDFVLLYAKREGMEAAFYQYDKKEQTIQRANLLDLYKDIDELNVEENINTTGNTVILFLLIGLSVLCILFIGITVIFYRKIRALKDLLIRQKRPFKKDE